MKDFPIALWKLFKNVPFMMLTGAATTEWFILSGLAVFAPKYMESQFNLSVSEAAFYTGKFTFVLLLLTCHHQGRIGKTPLVSHI